MAFRFQLRRDTAINWEAVDPVLLVGELAYETDTGRLKLGDGTSTWNELPYFLATVESVNGQIGIVVLDTDDIAESGPTAANKWFTPQRVANTLLGGENVQISYSPLTEKVTISSPGNVKFPEGIGLTSGAELPIIDEYGTTGSFYIGLTSASSLYRLGVGTTGPRAVLEVTSTDSGILFPRLTELEKNSMPNPIVGMVIYQTDAPEGLYQYKTGGWETIDPGDFSGTTNHVTKFTAANVLGNSIIYDDGTSVSIGASGAHPSALFQLSSTSKGFLSPKMSESERNLIPGPTSGLLIYNISTNKLNLWDGSKWAPAGGGLKLAGDADIQSLPLQVQDASDNGSTFYLGATSQGFLGRIGIGTTGPEYILDVRNSSRFSSPENTTPLTISDYSVTGNSFNPVLDISGTWNTTGSPTLIRANVTNTTSNANSLLMDLQVGGISQLNVGRGGITRGNFYNGGSEQTNTLNAGFARSGGNGSTTGIHRSFIANMSVSPSSGTAVFNQFEVSSPILQTGGANGITRGLYVNPTLTAAADWRSVEWSNNSGWGLYGGGTANNYLNGNLLIGTTTNTGFKLDVNGTGRASSLMVGTQSTIATNIKLEVDGKARIWNDLELGQFGVTKIKASTLEYLASGSDGFLFKNLLSHTATISTYYALGLENNINPSSGNAVFNLLQIKSTINQTGGANGITRGLYINPTLTSAADWRSIEWSNNSGWGLYGGSTANNYLNGNLFIGTTSNAGFKLDVNGTFRTNNRAYVGEDFTFASSQSYYLLNASDDGFVTFTNTSGSTVNQAVGFVSGELNLAGSAAFLNHRAINIITTVRNTNTSNIAVAFYASGRTGQAGAANKVAGFLGGVNIEGSGNVTNAIGLEVELFSQINNKTITNMYGVKVQPLVNSVGTITNTYGVYIDSLTAGTQTNAAYGIYQAGTDRNYFGGNVGIGTTTPTSKLQVSGSITASSALAQGVHFNNTLVASANNDVLVGLDINPTFTNGAFTGVNNIALRSQTGKVIHQGLTAATQTNQVYYNTTTGELTYGALPVVATPTLDQVTTAGNTTTNSITVGGLTVATNLIYTDIVNGRVGIGTISPSEILDVRGAIGVSGPINMGADPSATTQSTAVIRNVTTNSGIAIVPNGTGAITASIPDGTVAGGNARGIYAIDLQLVRTNTNQVAAGRYDFIGGGRSNRTATHLNGHNFIGGGENNSLPYGGHSVIVGGLNNSATVPFGTAASAYLTIGGGFANSVGSFASTVSGGQSNTASTGTHATVVGGQSNTSSGQYSVSGGFSNVASNVGAVALGYDTTASGYASVAIGYQANASGFEAVAIGRGVASGTRTVAIGREANVSGFDGAIAFVGGQVSGSGEGLGAAAFGRSKTQSIGGFSFGEDSLSYLRNQFSQSPINIYGGNTIYLGHSQASQVVAIKLGTLDSAATTVLSLDGTGTTNLIIPNGNNRAWKVKVEWVGTVTTISGTATGVTVGDSVYGESNFGFKRIGGTSSMGGMLNDSEAGDTAIMDTCLMSYSAGASQELTLTFTGPTFSGGGSVTMRVVAKVSLVEVAY